jgi:sec-independent protein translocase protein TatC
MTILMWPLSRAEIKYPGSNQVVSVSMGTNHLGRFLLNDEQQARYAVGSNRFVDLKVELVPSGTNFAVILVPKPAENPHLAKRLAVDLVNLGPVGGFVVALQLAMYGGLVLAAPFVFYYVAGFIFPALKMNEKYYVYRGLGFGLFLFLVGISFCYFVLLPIALSASVGYSNWLGLQANQWRAEEYISFVCKFMLGMGIGFQMPVVLLTLVKIGVLNYSILSKMRRYMIVVNLILGALLTTPEVITQVLMAIPLQFLYEVSVWIAWYWERRARKRAAAGED